MKYRPIQAPLLLRRLALCIEVYGVRGAIRDTYQRLSRSLRNRGFRGTFKRIVGITPKSPVEPVPLQTNTFDLIHGTDTGGFIYGQSLSTLHGTAYLGSSPSSLTPALSELPLRHEDFTFIDLGCGKGRALLVAAQFPFRHLFGVESAGELCDIARANAAIYSNWAARISIVNQHAKNFTYPDGPLLLYLYNPFFAPVLRRVLNNLERQLRHAPRPAFILYADNPRFTQVIDSFPFLRELSEMQYPLSSEDAALNPFNRTEEWYTLYFADFTL
jgi:SAM-dependent methyltransferase